MKKKILSLMGILLVTSMFSCGKKEVKETELSTDTFVSTKESETVGTETMGETEPVEETDSCLEVMDMEEALQECSVTAVYTMDIDPTQVLLVDVKGETIETLNPKEMIEKSALSEEEKEMILSGCFLGYWNDGFVFSLKDGDSKSYLVSYYDLKKDCLVMLQDQISSIISCSYRKGAIILDYHHISGELKEDLITLENDGEVVILDSPVSHILQGIKNYDFVEHLNYGYGRYYDQLPTFYEQFMEYGNILCTKNNKYFIVDTNLEIKEIEELSGMEVMGADRTFDSLVFRWRDSESFNVYSMLSLETGELSQLDCMPDFFLGMTDHGFYYADYEAGRTPVLEVSVCYFDFETRKVNQVLHEKCGAGMTREIPVISGFRYVNADCYYIAPEDGCMVWKKMKKDEYPAKAVSTGNVYKEYHFREYGTVEPIVKEYVCEDCGFTGLITYADWFKLEANENYPGAWKINEQIKENLMGNDEYFINEYCSESNESIADAHACLQELGEAYSDYYEYTLDDVRIVSDHYLVVDYMEYYTFAGASHGSYYPMSYLFDVNTGEQLTIDDLYYGSKNDLFTLLARKTAEHFNAIEEEDLPDYTREYDYWYKSFTSNPDSICISFCEDGIALVFTGDYFDFYAFETQYVEISYDELGFSLGD